MKARIALRNPLRAAGLRHLPPAARSAWPRTIAACLIATALSISAREALPEAADPALEARMVRITSELRCLVCQNQTIADSNASLAVDLRREARSLLLQGKSDAEVIDYMTARYGDFVLYRPPLRTTTFLLWFGPALMLVGGAAVLVLVLRRRSRMAAEAFDADSDDDDETGGDAAPTGTSAVAGATSTLTGAAG
jgi:cytochrome c-type biogenesis protein CcmH